jgi:uncharacterized membrane protein
LTARLADREARRIIRTRRDAERKPLNDDERAVLRIVERDLGRPLTDQEVEQARALGLV